MGFKGSAWLLASALISLYQLSFPQTSYKAEKNFFKKGSTKIIVEIRGVPEDAQDSIRINFGAIKKKPGYHHTADTTLGVKNGISKWSIEAGLPYAISTTRFFKDQNTFWIVEPGDSIIISYHGSEMNFIGKGAEKFELLNRIKKINDSLKEKLSNPRDTYTESLEDYLEWNEYLKKFAESLLTLIESYKSKVSPFAYNFIRDFFLNGIVDNRSDKFATFRAFVKRSGKLSLQDVIVIYDTTYAANTTEKYLPSMSRPFLGSWRPVMNKVLRKYSFNTEQPPLNSELNRHLLYLEEGLKIYTGFVREKFLEEFLTGEMIGDFGFVPEVEAALEKYYAEPGYPEHKKYVKDYEKKYRALRPGKPAPEFTLTDAKGNLFSKENIKGKVVLMDFWFTGCQGCISMTPVVRHLEEKFKNNPDIVFLSISIDENRSKWIKSLTEGKYTTGNGINLFTNKQGSNHPMIKSYGVDGYPSLFLINSAGNIAQNPLPDPRVDKGEKLIKLIEEQLALAKDGPYVLHDKSLSTVYTINGRSLSAKQFNNKELPQLTAQTDRSTKVFNIRLKQNMNVEPSEFAKPGKILVLSDIEGNFDALRKLLQSNNIIDEDYNWIFGSGHLVLGGDMFDRGEQVTECLWLIYSLEEKAKSAGGYVHFILGNHEIMNLSGDHRYIKEKYKQNAEKIGKSYAELYSSNSELGRWLRTKNIMEKIGNLLFVHGGISEEINKLPLSISQMNELARPWLDKSGMAQQSSEKNLALLFDSKDKLSPFWYRDYYSETEVKILVGGSKGIDTIYKTPMKVVDETLSKFGVNHIITGHTIVAYGNNVGDTISIHYNGKVFNTDTRHAVGRSEALLIERNKFYRVNDKGDKVLIYLKPDDHSL